MARKQSKHQWHQYLPINFPTFPHINPTVTCWILPTFDFFLGPGVGCELWESLRLGLAGGAAQCGQHVSRLGGTWRSLRGFWMLQLLTVTVRERCVLYYNLIVSCHIISLWVIIVSVLAGDHCNPWSLHSNCRFGDGLPSSFLLHPSGWLGRRRFL